MVGMLSANAPGCCAGMHRDLERGAASWNVEVARLRTEPGMRSKRRTWTAGSAHQRPSVRQRVDEKVGIRAVRDGGRRVGRESPV